MAAQGSGTLSGGQQRQVALARALYGEPALLALDEPEAGLDRPCVQALRAAVATMARRGAVVLLITHRAASWAGIAGAELRLLGDGGWTLHDLPSQEARR
jgi:ABC-type protease/lipase transport system fused ATPase/permease subunit